MEIKYILIYSLLLTTFFEGCDDDGKSMSVIRVTDTDVDLSSEDQFLGGEFMNNAGDPYFWDQDMYIGGGSALDAGLIIDDSVSGEEMETDAGITDMDTSAERVSFVQNFWSATHNSYEGDERGSILDQLNQGIRALEYDIHDNNFQSEGYRLGHLQYGDAVDYGDGNPNTDALGAWLDLINVWSNAQRDHAPLILTIDLKDNLMDNRNYQEGNLSHLNQVLINHLGHIWRPSMGLDSVESARGHTLCVLSGDEETRRGYLHDLGHSPALSISDDGDLLEVHDSGNGNLWYWSGLISMGNVVWKRHGRYDSGQRPSVLVHSSGEVIEVHQSESRSRLWASTGRLNTQGELTLNSARDFSDGVWPSLRWRDASRGLFSLRYQRNGRIYEREGEAEFTRGSLNWGPEQSLPNQSMLFDRTAQSFHNKQFQVSNNGSDHGYPINTLWLSISSNGMSIGEYPIRYEQVCFVEWQRGEYSDRLLGKQDFGALPGRSYTGLPIEVRESKVIRGWEFSGRDPLGSVPQIPSTDTPFRADYQTLVNALETVE